MKIILGLALVPMILLALTPPMHFALDCTINSTFWLWATFASGFFAFLFLYQKVSVWLKLLVVWLFISCFISKAPYMSFTMFWSAIVCAYYYALCRKITDWTPVKRSIQAVFFFIILLTIMQLSGKDTLLNFGASGTKIHGTIGNNMIASSFMCVLAPFLIFNPINWIVLGVMAFISGSSGAVLSIGSGFTVYAWSRFKRLRVWIAVIAIGGAVLFAWRAGDIKTFKGLAGRLPVYKKTVELSFKRPFGYGIGMYKVLFPILSGDAIQKEQPGREWRTAHNDWLQILFETGFIGAILFGGWLISILRRVKDPLKLAGITILAVNMMIHFPTRLVQSAFIIIMFLAFCSQGENNLQEA